MAVSRTSPPSTPYGGFTPTNDGIVNNEPLTKQSREYINLLPFHSSDVERKISLLEKIYAIAIQMTIPSLKSHRLHVVANEYCILGDIAKARAITQQLLEPDFSVMSEKLTLAHELSICEEARLVSVSCKNTDPLEKALKSLTTLRSNWIKVEILIDICEGFKRLENKPQAITVLKEICTLIEKLLHNGNSIDDMDSLICQIHSLEQELLGLKKFLVLKK
jgi:hypothetical protein